MADRTSKDDAEITAASKPSSMGPEKAQSGLHVAHSRIVLIPHPSDDPRDPLVCLHIYSSLIACEHHRPVYIQR